MKREEAVEIARKLYNESLFLKKDKEAMATLIPELAESYDEKIRKELIFFLEQEIPQCSIQEHADKLKQFIAYLEKQGKQKYIPKYKIGDYVKNTNYKGEPIYEIVYMDKECYICEYRGKERMGDKAVMHFSFDNPYLRLVQKPTDNVEPKFRVKYAGSEYNVLEVKDIAGVTYYGIEDEPNHIDYVKEDNCEIISGGYGIKENGSPYPTKPAVFSKQNSAWSEEDKKMRMKVLKYLSTRCNVFEYDEVEYWLKSLKDRVQPQPRKEWSNEEKNRINRIIAIIRNSMSGTPDDISWLKSLRPQNRWKPSEDHIKALDYIINHYTLLPNDLRENIKSLFEQLKAL